MELENNRFHLNPIKQFKLLTEFICWLLKSMQSKLCIHTDNKTRSAANLACRMLCKGYRKGRTQGSHDADAILVERCSSVTSGATVPSVNGRPSLRPHTKQELTIIFNRLPYFTYVTFGQPVDVEREILKKELVLRSSFFRPAKNKTGGI